jgi:hypothetical protein
MEEHDFLVIITQVSTVLRKFIGTFNISSNIELAFEQLSNKIL